MLRPANSCQTSIYQRSELEGKYVTGKGYRARFMVQGKNHYGALNSASAACIVPQIRAPHIPPRNSSLPCSLTELVDLPPRRRANAGVSGEQMLDVTGSEDDSGTRGGGYATVARLHTASCRDLAYDFPPCHSYGDCSKPHLIPTRNAQLRHEVRLREARRDRDLSRRVTGGTEKSTLRRIG